MNRYSGFTSQIIVTLWLTTGFLVIGRSQGKIIQDPAIPRNQQEKVEMEASSIHKGRWVRGSDGQIYFISAKAPNRNYKTLRQRSSQKITGADPDRITGSWHITEEVNFYHGNKYRGSIKKQYSASDLTDYRAFISTNTASNKYQGGLNFELSLPDRASGYVWPVTVKRKSSGQYAVLALGGNGTCIGTGHSLTVSIHWPGGDSLSAKLQR